MRKFLLRFDVDIDGEALKNTAHWKHFKAFVQLLIGSFDCVKLAVQTRAVPVRYGVGPEETKLRDD